MVLGIDKLLQGVMHLLVRYVFLLFSYRQVTVAKVSPSRFTYAVYQFEALAFANTAMCGGRLTFWYWVISAVPFYLATWEQ